MRRALLGLALVAGGCGGGAHHAAARAGATPELEANRARLSEVAPCKDVARATCATLRVPLDHSGRAPGTLRLRIAMSGPETAPVLVLLSGGPGQPGLPFLAPARRRLGATGRRLRLVTIDQRGTGRDALRCPALQRAMGASDLTPPSAAAVRSCATRIGERRRYFATTDTVADLEALREALGAGRIGLDGVSYGTYVAERYALAHPDRVGRLVLDSVVPHSGVTLTSEVSMKATERVLGAAATRALATVVRRRRNGPQMLDMLTALSIGRPQLTYAARTLKRAAAGDSRPLDRLAAAVRRGEGAYTATQLSQGLHASTLCADTRAPWGGASAPLADREPRLRAVAALVDTGPYDFETAVGNGFARTCLFWPPAPVPLPQLPADLPPVPTLLLAGTRDLSTPLEWARAERAHAPGGRLLVVPGAGHSVQTQDPPAVRRALARFF